METKLNSTYSGAGRNRFRPFYVASVAVMLVGLFGTAIVPKAHVANAINTLSAAASDTSVLDASEWLGPQEQPSTGLLNFTPSLSLLPFDFIN